MLAAGVAEELVRAFMAVWGDSNDNPPRPPPPPPRPPPPDTSEAAREAARAADREAAREAAVDRLSRFAQRTGGATRALGDALRVDRLRLAGGRE